MSYRARRLLYSRWRRLVRWEFWPSWAIYPPVAAYALWLGLRHRCLTLFTCANPGIPQGGVALESKSAILSAFGEAHPDIAPFALIPETADTAGKLEALDRFMAGRGLEFPVVLKPDIGERGLGVAVVGDRAAAREYLAACPGNAVAQAYVGGLEFGVFYARPPGGGRGRVTSITEKRTLVLAGDGRRTLERLILDHPRAVCYGKFLLDKHRGRLGEIPPEGAEVTVAELGTHARGALFLDGAGLLTPALEGKIDALSSAFDGFHFGRYDLKVPDAEALREGRDLQVLELNGVTSEPTHIYDPRHGLLHAWATLCGCWRQAFAIGAANRRDGARPTPLRELAALLWRFRKRERWEAGGTRPPAAAPEDGGKRTPPTGLRLHSPSE